MKNYIGSQQHFEDCVNEHYDRLEEMNKQMQKEYDQQYQQDDRIQCPKTYLTCEHGCTGKLNDCKLLNTPTHATKTD